MENKILLIELSEYKKELDTLIEKMIEAEKFAKEIPCLSEEILKMKSNKSFTGLITRSFKGHYFNWGLNRYHYSNEHKPTNFYEEYTGPNFLFSLYVNTLSIYDSHEKFGLEKLSDFCFYFDELNSIFYTKDSEIEMFLDEYCKWEDYATKEAFLKSKKEKIIKLKKQIEKLEVKS